MKRDIALIHTRSMLTNLVFILPVIVPYYASIGLSFRDFLIGEAVFSAVVLLAEVPSGWISDVWRRRTTLMVGALFAIIGYVVLLFADNLLMASLAQGIIGIAVALNSGTDTAMLYDLLLEKGEEGRYRRIDGKRHAMGIYAVAIAAIIGALCFKIDPQLPLLLEIFTLLAAMITISFVREPVRHTKSVEKHIIRDIWETMKYALRGHPEITGIILVSTVVMTGTKLMMWSQQPYFAGVGISVEWFGVIMAGSYVISGLVGHYSHTFEHWGSNRAALGTMVFVLTAACVTLVLFPVAIIGIPMFLIGTLAWAIGTPRVNNAINSRVGSERRATILSTANLMVHFLFIPTSLIVGYISDEGNIMSALLWIAGQVLILGSIGLWLWGRKR